MTLFGLNLYGFRFCVCIDLCLCGCVFLVFFFIMVLFVIPMFVFQIEYKRSWNLIGGDHLGRLREGKYCKIHCMKFFNKNKYQTRNQKTAVMLPTRIVSINNHIMYYQEKLSKL